MTDESIGASRASNQTPDPEWELIHGAIARLRASIMAVTFGLCGGAGLFFMTIFLVLRGGPIVNGEEVIGPRLGLLGNYFPGYEVTVGGSFIGLFYGALTGGILGWLLAWLYNFIAGKRQVKS
jgi:hypothetical protein